MNRNIFKQAFGATLLAAAMLGQSALAAPFITTSGLPATVSAGSNYGVDVYINNVTDLFAWQFNLNYNAGVLNFVGANEGNFLTGTGDGAFFAGLDGPGTVFAANAAFGPSGVSGSGLLAHFDFTATSSGSAGFSISDLLFLNSALDDVGAVVPEPATVLLLALAMAGMTLARRRQQR